MKDWKKVIIVHVYDISRIFLKNSLNQSWKKINNPI